MLGIFHILLLRKDILQHYLYAQFVQANFRMKANKRAEGPEALSCGKVLYLNDVKRLHKRS